MATPSLGPSQSLHVTGFKPDEQTEKADVHKLAATAFPTSRVNTASSRRP